ncbi:MAG TPA: hypothetical protein VGG33_05905 [Polyangia bacterium]
MLLHDVKVVEQPLARRTYVEVPTGAQSRLRVEQDAAGLVQACKQSRSPPPRPSVHDALGAGDRTRSLGQVIGAQSLAVDETAKPIVRFSAASSGADEAAEPCHEGRGSRGGHRVVGKSGSVARHGAHVEEE